MKQLQQALAKHTIVAAGAAECSRSLIYAQAPLRSLQPQQTQHLSKSLQRQPQPHSRPQVPHLKQAQQARVERQTRLGALQRRP